MVIDGAKALRAAIREVLGGEQLVQRCRPHKLRDVVEHLPAHDPMLQNQVRSLMRAAGRIGRAEEGMARMRKPAEMLEAHHREAARSLLEGLEETFTIHRFEVPPRLHRCLATTHIIESPQAGVRKKTANVSSWRDGKMVLRWVAGAFLLTERRYRRIMGHQDLWALAAIVGRRDSTSHQREVA